MKLIHKITKDREGTYYYIPFSVPENVIKVTVSYDYFRPTKGMLSDLKPTNCIDIGLSNSRGNFLGWSGSAHPSVSVGEYSSTNGDNPGSNPALASRVLLCVFPAAAMIVASVITFFLHFDKKDEKVSDN